MPLSWLKKKYYAFEQYTVDVILGRREDTGATVYGAFLQGVSILFSGVVQLRLWLYRQRLLHDQPLGCLVVVVGNLTVGGTGKTPVVEKFARALADRGRKVAILSRPPRMGVRVECPARPDRPRLDLARRGAARSGAAFPGARCHYPNQDR